MAITGSFCAYRARSRGFYRWHPLYGRRVRRQYSEQRATGEVVHVEASPGIVIVVAAWMLNAASCSAMELGSPRASLEALGELHLLLCQRELRRSCGVHTTSEEPHGPATTHEALVVDLKRATPNGATPDEHGVRVSSNPGSDRERAHQRGRSAGQPASTSRRTAHGG